MDIDGNAYPYGVLDFPSIRFISPCFTSIALKRREITLIGENGCVSVYRHFLHTVVCHRLDKIVRVMKLYHLNRSCYIQYATELMSWKHFQHGRYITYYDTCQGM